MSSYSYLKPPSTLRIKVQVLIQAQFIQPGACLTPILSLPLNKLLSASRPSARNAMQLAGSFPYSSPEPTLQTHLQKHPYPQPLPCFISFVVYVTSDNLCLICTMISSTYSKGFTCLMQCYVPCTQDRAGHTVGMQHMPAAFKIKSISFDWIPWGKKVGGNPIS